MSHQEKEHKEWLKKLNMMPKFTLDKESHVQLLNQLREEEHKMDLSRQHVKKLKWGIGSLTGGMAAFAITFLIFTNTGQSLLNNWVGPIMNEPRQGVDIVKPNIDKEEIADQEKIKYFTEFELSPELISIYEEYAKTRDDELLKNLEPFDVFRLYYYSKEQEDWETQYALYIHDEQYLIPTWEMFKKDMEKMDEQISVVEKFFIGQLKNNVSKFEQKILIETDLTVSAGITIYFEEEVDQRFPRSFGLIKNKEGIWKVKWLPVQ